MEIDDEICYCYHVSMRKLMHYSRRVKPQRPSLMTGCLGAGTGCGWCVPFLVKIAEDPDAFALSDMTVDQYAESRKTYRTSGQTKHTFEEPNSGQGGA